DLLTSEGFRVTAWDQHRLMTPEELKSAAKEHDVLFCSSADKLTEDFLRSNRHLQCISQFAAGYDNIDISVATELKIPVGNTPGAMKKAASDVAFGLMIAVSRKMFFNH